MGAAASSGGVAAVLQHEHARRPLAVVVLVALTVVLQLRMVVVLAAVLAAVMPRARMRVLEREREPVVLDCGVLLVLVLDCGVLVVLVLVQCWCWCWCWFMVPTNAKPLRKRHQQRVRSLINQADAVQPARRNDCPDGQESDTKRNPWAWLHDYRVKPLHTAALFSATELSSARTSFSFSPLTHGNCTASIDPQNCT